MADSVTYIRDVESGEMVPIKLNDNGDGTFNCGGAIVASIVEGAGVRDNG